MEVLWEPWMLVSQAKCEKAEETSREYYLNQAPRYELSSQKNKEKRKGMFIFGKGI